MQRKIVVFITMMRFVPLLHTAYFFLLPFLGFLAIGIKRPELIAGIAMTGWLPMVLFWYFKGTLPMSVWTLMIKAVTIGAVALGLLGSGDIWSFFAQVLLFELATFSMVLSAFFCLHVLRALREGMLFVLLFSLVVVGGSAGYLLYAVLQAEHIQLLSPSMWAILTAIIIDLASETRFFLRLLRKEVTLNDEDFENRIPLYGVGILFWIVGLPGVFAAFGLW